MSTNASVKKPSGLPKNWPNPASEDLAAFPRRKVSLGVEQAYEFCTNFIKTSKYEYYNFVPKFLLESFNFSTKLANCYFLMIAALQTVPAISNTDGKPTTLIPLVIVLTFDAIFAAMEDLVRHKADAEANASVTKKLNKTTKTFEDMYWSDIQIGDILLISTRENIPADCIVLSVHEKDPVPQGLCYVETKSLDGETNLKIKQALPGTLASVRTIDDLMTLKGTVTMEHPNKVVHSFTGAIEIDGNSEVVSENNLLLRGCVLRNTEWVFALVVNTGTDTKIMMSATVTPTKSSFLETQATREVLNVVILLVVLSIIGATGMTIWNSQNETEAAPYLLWDVSAVSNWFIQFFYIMLLHATFCPVSLYVSLTFARFGQSYFMQNDLEMYYEKTDTPMKVRTATLNEELGQISHIFSDKTGTLTCNIMDFRKASINGITYGVGITEIGKASWKLQGKEISKEILQGEAMAAERAVPHVSFYCPRYDKIQEQNPQYVHEKPAIDAFFKVISLCHDVIPENINGTIKLSASNPDDEALVAAAAYFGYQFSDKKEKNAIITTEDGEESVIIEEIIEFSSKRKRMSVVVREKGQLKLMMKGADTAIIPRLATGQNDLLQVTLDHMSAFSEEGLRCLLVGENVLDESTFADWQKRYKVASSNVDEIEKKKQGLPNVIETIEEELEKGLTLLGCTAIEDKLQDGVPECIELLTKAGLSIWVLTGDKEETAINIAVACNLVLPPAYMEHIIINPKICQTKEDLRKFLTEQIDRAESMKNVKNKLPKALIIDGPSLLIGMADTEADVGVKALILKFSEFCRVVVGCRVSPDQKREMVNLIKTGIPGVRTLSVGDGANDVAMIQEAHIGVGIKGEEGVQAVNASDYAIAQFRYLGPLILYHGRNNYVRISYLIIYNFYKNIFMSMGQYWFNFLNGFSGQKYYTEMGIQAFNVPFTFAPILMYACYDMQTNRESAYKFPDLYKSSMKNEYFTSYLFWMVMFQGILESAVCCLVPLAVMDNGDPDSGVLNSFLEPGSLCLTAVIILTNVKIFFVQVRVDPLHVVVMVLSILSWFALAFLVDRVQGIIFVGDSAFLYTFTKALNMPSFWLGLFFLIVLILGKDIAIFGYQRSFKPTNPQIVQEIEQRYKKHAATMTYDEFVSESDYSGRRASRSTTLTTSAVSKGETYEL